MKVLALGASRNIEYHASLRLLERGDTVTFLLRSTEAFEKDPVMAPHIGSGKARLVQGDAMKEEGVKRAWASACLATSGSSPSDEGQVDLLLVTISESTIPDFKLASSSILADTYPTGATKGSFHPFNGVLINPADICTRTILNALSTCPESTTPRIVALSTTGLGSNHDALPFVYKPLYGWMLSAPHVVRPKPSSLGFHSNPRRVLQDKLGLERVLHHVNGRQWTEKTSKERILPAGWEKRLPNWHFETVIVRPALLTDGDCKMTYRVGEGDINSAYYKIRRQDVAHFIIEGLLLNWAKWSGKTVSISY